MTKRPCLCPTYRCRNLRPPPVSSSCHRWISAAPRLTSRRRESEERVMDVTTPDASTDASSRDAFMYVSPMDVPGWDTSMDVSGGDACMIVSSWAAGGSQAGWLGGRSPVRAESGWKHSWSAWARISISGSSAIAMSVTRCPCHVRIALPSTCHRMTCLSSPAEMKRSPVGSQAHEVTPHLCLEKVRTQAAESVSHSLSTVSLPHDSSRRSSGDHAR
mmetsp:Transcript_3306/g.11138  ORF Transcript_3306/g.11138 Transcript_3306/m.11138 type:complete len:217 (+) Transcript_3306:585-1235(+)